MNRYKNDIDILRNHEKEEYMSEAQREFFKNRLEHDKSDLVKRIETVKHEITQLQSNESDDNDNATSEEIVNRNLSLVQRQTRLLHKIENALDRISTGEYGYCEATGEPIGIPRLLARPSSSLSIEAKEQKEMIEKREEL